MRSIIIIFLLLPVFNFGQIFPSLDSKDHYTVFPKHDEFFYSTMSDGSQMHVFKWNWSDHKLVDNYEFSSTAEYFRCSESGRYLIYQMRKGNSKYYGIYDTQTRKELPTNSKHEVLLLFNEETNEVVFSEANKDGFGRYNLTVYSLPDLKPKKVLAELFVNYSNKCYGNNPYSDKCLYRDKKDEKYYVYRSETEDVVPLKTYYKLPKRMGSEVMLRSMFYQEYKGKYIYAMNSTTGEKIHGFGFPDEDFGNGYYGGESRGKIWIYDGHANKMYANFDVARGEYLQQFLIEKNKIFSSIRYQKSEGGRSMAYCYNITGEKIDSIQLNPASNLLADIMSEDLKAKYKSPTVASTTTNTSNSQENKLLLTGNYEDPSLITDPIPFPVNHRDHPLYKLAKKYSEATKWTEARAYWNEFSKRYPGVADAYYFEAEANFFLKEYEKALPGFEQAHQMDPMNNRYMLLYLNCMAYYQYADRGAEIGKKMASISDQGLAPSIRAEFDKLIANNGAGSTYSKPIILAKNAFNSHFASINTNDELYKSMSNSYSTVGAKTWEGIWTNFTDIRTKLKNRGAEAAVYQFLLQDYYNHIDGKKGGDWIQSKIAKEFINEYNRGEYSNLYHEVNVGQKMAQAYFNKDDYEKANILVDKLISQLSNEGLFRYKLLELYQLKARLLYEMDRNTEFSAIAKQLENINGEFKNPGFNARTLEMLALMHKNSNFEKSEKSALEALAIAEKNQMDRVKSLNSLLSIIYFDHGDIQKGLKYTGIEGDLAKMNEIELFNAASMLEDVGRLDQAEEFYLKSIEKTKKILEGKSDREKLTKRAKYEPIYNGLASVYNKQNKAEKVFEVIENSKSQGLASTLQAKEVNVKQIQALLKPDEAFVSYKILDPSNFMVTIITKNDVQCSARSLTYLVNPLKINFGDALYNLDKKLSAENYDQPNFVKPAAGEKDESKLLNEGDFNLAIEFYRAFLTQELGQYLPGWSQADINKVGNVMQKEFYGTFVWPLEQAVGKKKKYYLSLDGALNFIPFESFKDENENYLGATSQFNIVSSAGILDLISHRNYSSDKKSVLAFGGAIYEEAQSNVNRVKSLSEVRDWQLKAFDLTNEGKPLTDLFYALGYGKMKYLKGTLAEVKEIEKIQPDATIITGADMTEKRVKDLSQTGELKKYKTLHFATHGWAINNLPTTSGLAMCIPKTSTDGEDGRLIANEIAQLNIEADMVMLSACQTGLGKLYGGEGVTGLNQALFIAGANSTIVSLWPVNDYATSILVSELYSTAKTNGGDYAAALLQVKRNFIAGKYNKDGVDLTHPIYWAPFVYNGK